MPTASTFPTVTPSLAVDPNDSDIILVTLRNETWMVRKSEIAAILAGARTSQAIAYQFAIALASSYPNLAAIQAATNAELATVIETATFYW